MQLDATDQKIIALLRDNARLPTVTLAKKINLSRSAVQERLKRLERDRIIGRYTLQFGDAASNAARAWLTIKFREGYTCSDIVPSILQTAEVRVCHSIAGSIDLLVLIEGETTGEIFAVRERFAGIKGIAEVHTAPVLQAHYG